MGLVAPQRVESSQTRDRSCVPCIGRRILIHCTPGKPLSSFFRPASELGTEGIALALKQYQPCVVGKGACIYIKHKESPKIPGMEAPWRQGGGKGPPCSSSDYCCGLVVSNYIFLTKAGHDLFFALKDKKKNLEKHVLLWQWRKNLRHFKFIVDIYLNSISHLDFSAFMKS